AILHPDVKTPNGTPVSLYEGIFFLQNKNINNGNPIVDPGTLRVNNNNVTTVVNQMPSLARQLLMITKLMAGRQCLDNRRQIFFCSYGGHDTHQDQGGYTVADGYVAGDLDDNMVYLNDSLKAFHDCMKELESQESGLPAGEGFTYNDFILASHSDFNRTFTPNGIIPGPSGSDHAWGTHVFAMGGDVKGKNVFGYYPDLDPTGAWGTPGSSRGRWIPTTAVEQFAAPLAKWLGTDNTEIETIFPNLERFADPFTAGYDPTDYSSMLNNANMDYINGI
ncbi:MAG: DUF1501 domain-containing protein, partial [Akkermansiaceae bacterium]|nr:DUF1501 domain-containing protein [Akkermansiaceae bacterium]